MVFTVFPSHPFSSLLPSLFPHFISINSVIDSIRNSCLIYLILIQSSLVSLSTLLGYFSSIVCSLIFVEVLQPNYRPVNSLKYPNFCFFCYLFLIRFAHSTHIVSGNSPLVSAFIINVYFFCFCLFTFVLLTLIFMFHFLSPPSHTLTFVLSPPLRLLTAPCCRTKRILIFLLASYFCILHAVS